jgi:PhoPQ-activated pathogenicity-related protein
MCRRIVVMYMSSYILTVLGDLNIHQQLCQQRQFNGTSFASTICPYLYQIIDSVGLPKFRALDDKNAIFLMRESLYHFKFLLIVFYRLTRGMCRVAMYLIHR